MLSFRIFYTFTNDLKSIPSDGKNRSTLLVGEMLCKLDVLLDSVRLAYWPIYWTEKAFKRVETKEPETL
jgi:hypothetical protein